MKFIIIKIYNNKIEENLERSTYFSKILIKILKKIIPQANPDYDEFINDINIWYLEFESENEPPTREIGVSNSDLVLAKMPYKDNYGYWTDNNLNYHDFAKTFEIQETTKEDFEKKWSSFGDLKYEQ